MVSLSTECYSLNAKVQLLSLWVFVPQCWDNFLIQSERLVRSILWCNAHMFFSGTCVCTVEEYYVVLANSWADLWPLGSSPSSPPLMHIQWYKSSHGLKMFMGRLRKNSFHRPGIELRGHVLSSHACEALGFDLRTETKLNRPEQHNTKLINQLNKLKLLKSNRAQPKPKST